MANVDTKTFISLDNLRLYDAKIKELIELNKIWVGTRAEYEKGIAEGTIADGRIVLITDDYDDTIDALKQDIGDIKATGHTSVTNYIQTVEQNTSVTASSEDISRLFL